MTRTGRRRLLTWAIVYAMAVALSHLVRARTREAPPGADEEAVSVPAVGPKRAPPVRIVFARVCPPVATGPPVVLIHGSPGSKTDLSALVPPLARDRCVLRLDLPGFGGSTADIPDYSFRAHAEYVREWLESMGVSRAHVLGFSMGGGVALSLADLDPPRVASLTLLSAIGVQEHELFGRYEVNHAVHAALVAGLWILQEATPHMGWLDQTPFTVAFARNFFDSDQRPLRRILTRVEVPVLIAHGAADSLVPIEAAREHYRLVPHSEFLDLDGGHFHTFRHGGSIGGRVARFLARVDAGLARTRRTADPTRLREAGRPADASPLALARGLPRYVAVTAVCALLTLWAGMRRASRRRKWEVGRRSRMGAEERERQTIT